MDTATVVTQQGSAILLIPLLVEYMKQSNLPVFGWIDGDTQKINRFISWSLGIIAAVGIHWVADCQGAICSATIDFSHFNFAGAFHSTAAVGVQLGGQQLMYKGLKIADALDQWLAQQNGKKV